MSQSMDAKPTNRPRRELLPEDFRRLLGRLDADPVRASEAYETLRRQLLRFFLKNQQHCDAEALADKVLDELAKKPDSYEIENIAEYAIGVARYVQMDHYRRNSSTAHLAEGQDFSGDDENPEYTVLEGIDADRKLGCFLQCIESLKPQERWLILEYYPAENRNLEERRRMLAAILGSDSNALTSRMNRLRGKLMRCCLDCYTRATKKSSPSSAGRPVNAEMDGKEKQ
jgi:DNA-directed RNA polymerase specialized sigma24 family protein